MPGRGQPDCVVQIMRRYGKQVREWGGDEPPHYTTLKPSPLAVTTAFNTKQRKQYSPKCDNGEGNHNYSKQFFSHFYLMLLI